MFGKTTFCNQTAHQPETSGCAPDDFFKAPMTNQLRAPPACEPTHRGSITFSYRLEAIARRSKHEVSTTYLGVSTVTVFEP